MLDRIVAAEARPDYHIWVRYEDGLEGEVSVKHLVGRGVFASWLDEGEFQRFTSDSRRPRRPLPGDPDCASGYRGAR